MTHCARCHRPLTKPSIDGYGPVCRKAVGPVPSHERDLFGFDVALAADAALFRLDLGIAVMASQARRAVREAFKQARVRLGVWR